MNAQVAGTGETDNIGGTAWVKVVHLGKFLWAKRQNLKAVDGWPDDKLGPWRVKDHAEALQQPQGGTAAVHGGGSGGGDEI